MSAPSRRSPPPDSPAVIQSLWVGDRLSTMERLCISSFLKHGHEFHLYAYNELENVPPGTVLRDAGEILPSSAIFLYKNWKSYSGFSNFFRYKLLLERGGWWADTDMICIRPWDFPGEHVFGSEMLDGSPHATSSVLKAPPQSAVMRAMWEECQRADPLEMAWGQCGPKLVYRTVQEFRLQACVQPPAVFCPLAFDEWKRLLEPRENEDLSPDTRAVHLWHEMWRREDCSPDGPFDPHCLYERLKSRYLL